MCVHLLGKPAHSPLIPSCLWGWTVRLKLRPRVLEEAQEQSLKQKRAPVSPKLQAFSYALQDSWSELSPVHMMT